MLSSKANLELGLEFIVRNIDISLTNILLERRRGTSTCDLTDNFAVLGCNFGSISGRGTFNDETRSLVLYTLLNFFFYSVIPKEAPLFLPSL